MLLIHVTTAQGATHDVAAQEGQTLLEAVLTSGVDGLLGEWAVAAVAPLATA